MKGNVLVIGFCNLGVRMTALYCGVGFLAKMKEGAENVQTKLQAHAEIVGFKPTQVDGKGKQLLNK
jgi:hypothetical protein